MNTKQKITKYWPGTGIVKSTGNAFTIKNIEPTQEELDIEKRMEARRKRKASAKKKKNVTGFGQETMSGLSNQAVAQLKNAPNSICIGKKSDTTKRQKIAKAAI